MPDYVAETHYARHLKGVAKFAANPVTDRYSILYRYHIKRITELAMNRFKWLNMPKTVDVRFLELTLFRNALAVFYYDYDVERFFAAQGTAGSRRDMFDNPTSFRVIGNGYIPTKRLPLSMCHPIWANYLRVPDHDLVLLWAHRIADLEVSIEINARNARRPRVLAYDENTRLSAQNINEAINRGDPTIEVTPDIAASGFLSAFDLGVLPDSHEKLHILRVRLENQMMSELGINNANQDKKERLVSDEVDANNDAVSVARAVNLNARKFAALNINDKFGLNIEVEYGADVAAEIATQTDGAKPGGVPENWPGNASPETTENAK